MTSPPRDLVLCMNDFLIKEEILRAACNKPRITLDNHLIQIYPDISPATLDRRRSLKEITAALQSAHIRYRWGFPFKLLVPHNGTTFSASSLQEGQEILVKLGLLDAAAIRRPPSTPHLANPTTQERQKEDSIWHWRGTRWATPMKALQPISSLRRSAPNFLSRH